MVDNLTGTFALPGLATTTDTVQAVQKKEDQRIKTIIQIKERQQMKASQRKRARVFPNKSHASSLAEVIYCNFKLSLLSTKNVLFIYLFYVLFLNKCSSFKTKKSTPCPSLSCKLLSIYPSLFTLFLLFFVLH